MVADLQPGLGGRFHHDDAGLAGDCREDRVFIAGHDSSGDIPLRQLVFNEVLPAALQATGNAQLIALAKQQ